MPLRTNVYVDAFNVYYGCTKVYAKMAVELYGSYYRHSVIPQYRIVGGGVDTVTIQWS